MFHALFQSDGVTELRSQTRLDAFSHGLCLTSCDTCTLPCKSLLKRNDVHQNRMTPTFWPQRNWGLRSFIFNSQHYSSLTGNIDHLLRQPLPHAQGRLRNNHCLQTWRVFTIFRLPCIMLSLMPLQRVLYHPHQTRVWFEMYWIICHLQHMLVLGHLLI